MALLGKKASAGVPPLVLHESEGFIVTAETRNGWVYRGFMEHAEDNFNVRLRDVAVTDPQGNKSHSDAVFLRGSTVTFFILPDMLSKLPIFKRMANYKKGIVLAGGLGRNRQKAIMARMIDRSGGPGGFAPRGPPRGGGGFGGPPRGPPPGYGGPPRGPPMGGGMPMGGPPRGYGAPRGMPPMGGPPRGYGGGPPPQQGPGWGR